MKLVAIQTRRRVEGRKTYEVIKGQTYNSNSKLVAKFPRSAFQTLRQYNALNGHYTTWAQEELELIVDQYLKAADPHNNSDSRQAIVDAYLAEYTNHTSDQAELIVRRLVGADTFYAARGMGELGILLQAICDDRAPGRFDGTDKLDLLLDELRAA